MQNNSSNTRREEEETDMNKHSNIKISDTQEHTINAMPDNKEMAESSKRT